MVAFRALALLLALAACQQMPGDNALPMCQSHCTVVVMGEQVRGGNSPSPTASIPLIP